MKVTLESTDKMVELVVDGHTIPARVWEGHTEDGVCTMAFVTRILCMEPERSQEFDKALQETRAPSPVAGAIESRLVL